MSGAWQMWPQMSLMSLESEKELCPQSWPTTKRHHMKKPESDNMKRGGSVQRQYYYEPRHSLMTKDHVPYTPSLRPHNQNAGRTGEVPPDEEPREAVGLHPGVHVVQPEERSKVPHHVVQGPGERFLLVVMSSWEVVGLVRNNWNAFGMRVQQRMNHRLYVRGSTAPGWPS